MKSITINKNDSNQRLDKILQKKFPDLPNSLMFKEIRKKNIKVNKKRCYPNDILHIGDIVDIYIKDELLVEAKIHYDFLKAPKIPTIVYEDENVIILDKPQGMLCHPDGNEYVNNLVSSLKRYLYEKKEYDPDNENTFSPSLANRLDRNTGGLVIGAKNHKALVALNKRIKERSIKKTYLTVVQGVPSRNKDILSGYLTKNKNNKVTISENETKNSKLVKTGYSVLSSYNNISLLEIDLITGRTHQIRAQLAKLGHPIIGDGKYGKNQGRYKQELYSYFLEFNPSDTEDILDYLNGKKFESKDCSIMKKFQDKEY